VLLRYAVSARIAPIAQPHQPGIWTIPFWLGERRIPQIGAGREKRFELRGFNLEVHLRQLHREGYWPTALRIEIMAEPKKGEDLSQKIWEKELPVVWQQEGGD